MLKIRQYSLYLLSISVLLFPILFPQWISSLSAQNYDISKHARNNLTAMKAEEAGYGMYTYVLLKQDYLTKVPIREKYKELLKAIMHVPDIKVIEKQFEHNKSQFNMFYVPALNSFNSSNNTEHLDNYNFELAGEYAIRLQFVTFSTPEQKHLERMISDNSGPFLISAYTPLFEVKNGDPMMFVDLSSTDSNAIETAVNLYKKKLGTEKLEDRKKFKSFKLSMLNTLLTLDDSIQIFQAAFADWGIK